MNPDDQLADLARQIAADRRITFSAAVRVAMRQLPQTARAYADISDAPAGTTDAAGELVRLARQRAAEKGGTLAEALRDAVRRNPALADQWSLGTPDDAPRAPGELRQGTNADVRHVTEQWPTYRAARVVRMVTEPTVKLGPVMALRIADTRAVA